VERLLRDARVFAVYEGTTAIQALDLSFRQIFGQGREAAMDVLERLQPAPALAARLREVIDRIAGFNRAARERAALPLLRLFGLVCADGALRRHAGPVERFRALLAVHEGLAGAEMERLLALCDAPGFDREFEVIFKG
jgi:hypothetical protein